MRSKITVETSQLGDIKLTAYIWVGGNYVEAGYCWGYIGQEDSLAVAAGVKKYAEITSLNVWQEFRERGIGERLLQRFTSKCGESVGFIKLYAEPCDIEAYPHKAKKTKTSLEKWYRKSGFQKRRVPPSKGYMIKYL